MPSILKATRRSSRLTPNLNKADIQETENIMKKKIAKEVTKWVMLGPGRTLYAYFGPGVYLRGSLVIPLVRPSVGLSVRL